MEKLKIFINSLIKSVKGKERLVVDVVKARETRDIGLLGDCYPHVFWHK